VHVSAHASAAADLQYAKKVQNILAWETAKEIPIYPPPKLYLPASPEIPIIHDQEESPFITPYVPPLYTPAQIPDSQPRSLLATPPLILDLISHSPSQLAQNQAQSSGSQAELVSTTGNTRLPVSVYQDAHRPPRASSLQPHPPSSPPIDPRLTPSHQLPLFPSTPDSKSLKSLLPKTVSGPLSRCPHQLFN
jgi:hypothetical protein